MAFQCRYAIILLKDVDYGNYIEIDYCMCTKSFIIGSTFIDQKINIYMIIILICKCVYIYIYMLYMWSTKWRNRTTITITLLVTLCLSGLSTLPSLVLALYVHCLSCAFNSPYLYILCLFALLLLSSSLSLSLTAAASFTIAGHNSPTWLPQTPSSIHCSSIYSPFLFLCLALCLR